METILKRLEHGGMIRIEPAPRGWFVIRELIGGDNSFDLSRDELEALGNELIELSKSNPKETKAKEIWNKAMRDILAIGVMPYIDDDEWKFRELPPTEGVKP